MNTMKSSLFIFIVFFSCLAFASEKCSKLLSQKLPAHVEAITNTFPLTSGPNCHNAVAYWHGLVDEFRPVTGRELETWLSNRKIFRKLRAAEPLMIGDVIVFRLGPHDLILHSSIYLSPRRFWQKEGDWKEAGWQVTPSAPVYREYEGLITEGYRKLP